MEWTCPRAAEVRSERVRTPVWANNLPDRNEGEPICARRPPSEFDGPHRDQCRGLRRDCPDASGRQRGLRPRPTSGGERLSGSRPRWWIRSARCGAPARATAMSSCGSRPRFEMPDDGYAYHIDQCDVPKERRPALSRFREKRREWLSWLDTDEHHAIWPTLHSMVRTDLAFNVLRRFAEGNDENALNNPLIVEALLKGHFATQVLAIRNFHGGYPQRALSLRRLVTDLKRHRAPCSRGKTISVTTVCGTTIKPFATLCSVSSRQKRRIRSSSCGGLPKAPRPTVGPRYSHHHFDKLAGIDPVARTQEANSASAPHDHWDVARQQWCRCFGKMVQHLSSARRWPQRAGEA